MTMDDLLFSADLSSEQLYRHTMGAGESGEWMGSNKILLVAALKDLTENIASQLRLLRAKDI